MNDPLESLVKLLISLIASGLIVYILAVFARILWLAVTYIWTFGAG